MDMNSEEHIRRDEGIRQILNLSISTLILNYFIDLYPKVLRITFLLRIKMLGFCRLLKLVTKEISLKQLIFHCFWMIRTIQRCLTTPGM